MFDDLLKVEQVSEQDENEPDFASIFTGVCRDDPAEVSKREKLFKGEVAVSDIEKQFMNSNFVKAESPTTSYNSVPVKSTSASATTQLGLN